ncbi:MAG TPA: 50S ribosomal protein L29 [Kandleria vitulina]|nr:50S ribosomal protein L29 [Kandleria vitulina]
MKVADIRNIETTELLKKVEEFKKELFSLRFQQATGQLENTARIREVRKSIAKIKTVIRERELSEVKEAK